MERLSGVAAVVLAAGESRRFGSPKQLAVLAGRTLLEHVLETARKGGLAPVVAVVPIWLTRPASMDDADLLWVRNPHPERGMSHSLRLGLEALPGDVEAAVILLGDQPVVPEDHLRSLVAARGRRPVIATTHRDVRQPPTLVERSHFLLASSPSGDIGLREVLDASADLVATVELAEAPSDIDTPSALRDLEAGRGPASDA